MAREVDDQFDQVVPGAAGRGGQFLGVLQERCREQGLGINLQVAKRRGKDGGIVLRAPMKAGRGSGMELEVFADPMGTSLHVGWQTTCEVIGNLGRSFTFTREMQRIRDSSRNSAATTRALSGILQAFQATVFVPVLQQLVEATDGGSQNGFLGA